MTLPTLTPSHVFGIDSNVKNNICYIDDATVIYPVGFQLVQYNFEHKTQKFLPLNGDGEPICAMRVSPIISLAAVGFRISGSLAKSGNSGSNAVGSADASRGASVVLYDLLTWRKRKVLATGDAPTTSEFVSIAYSHDYKVLVALGCAPDWCLYVWSIEKGKLNAWSKTVVNTNAAANDVSCNPFDPFSTQICVTGNNLFRIYRLTDNTLKLLHQNKMERNITCHTWINETRVIAGTRDSKILVYESGEFILEISYVIPHFITNDETPPPIPAVNTITHFSSGLVIGLSTGVVVLFDRTDDHHLYKKNKEYLVEEAEISSVALCPHEENAIITMKNSQIYTITLDIDATQKDEAKCERFAQPFHSGPIIAMSVSTIKPLLATSSLDYSIRVWDYRINTMEVVKYFDDCAQCIAIHPNGLYLLAAFPYSVKLMAILIDNIQPYWDVSVHACRDCRFSTGGQYFSVACGTAITIYHTWTFEILGNLRAPTKFKTVAWSADDTKILTTSMDGSAAIWNVLELKKETTIPIPEHMFIQSVILNQTGTAAYVFPREGSVREIVNGSLSREFPLKGDITNCVISNSDSMMFAASARGAIRAIKYPFDYMGPVDTPSDSSDYVYHSAGVTRILTSFDDQYLFSCGHDGCIWIYHIHDKGTRAARQDKAWTYSDEVLITKSDLDYNHRTMNDLKQRVDELRAESDAQLKQKDASYESKLKDLITKYSAEVESLKQKHILLKTENEESKKRQLDENDSIRQKHKAECQELDTSFAMKMQSEAKKYNDLFQKMQLLQSQWRAQMAEIESTHESKIIETNTYYKKLLQEKQDVLKKSKATFQIQKGEFETLMSGIENDVDRESVQICHAFETKLKMERESLKSIKAENSSMKSKFDGLTRQIDEHKRELLKGQAEEKKLHSVIKSLESDIVGVKKEIQEREDTIFDKEKRMYDLKKKNQELEKFKFVLDYKIVELRKQVEPRERDIDTLTSQINEMSQEVKDYGIRHNEATTEYLGMIMKHQAVQNEKFSEEWRSNQVQSVIKRFQHDLAQVYKCRKNMAELKKHFAVMYNKYKPISTDPPANPPASAVPAYSRIELFQLIDKIGLRKRSVEHQIEPSVTNDEEIESAKVREHLEKTIAVLKENLKKERAKRSEKGQKMALENIQLTSEVNLLHVSLKKQQERLMKLTKAKKKGTTLREFLDEELKTKTIKQLINPHIPGALLNKTTMPLPPALPPIPPKN